MISYPYISRCDKSFRIRSAMLPLSNSRSNGIPRTLDHKITSAKEVVYLRTRVEDSGELSPRLQSRLNIMSLVDASAQKV